MTAAAARAQTAPEPVELANLNEDVRGLTERVNDLSLRIEQLEHENAALQRQAEAAGQGYATVAQLDAAVAALNRAIQAAVGQSKDEVLRRVAEQMDKLARQTNVALDSLAGRSASPARAAGDFPKEGVSYVVQRGDTLASIAKKSGARIEDIIQANRIADPSRIQVGQTLFLPLANPPK